MTHTCTLFPKKYSDRLLHAPNADKSGYVIPRFDYVGDVCGGTAQQELVLFYCNGINKR
jgi:hypothetical protein